MARYLEAAPACDNPPWVEDSVVTVHMEVLVAERAVPVVFVIRRRIVEVWLMGSVTATIARADLATWFEGSVGPLQVPALKFAVPVTGEVSITLPGLDDWRLSPVSRTKLRDAVCRDLEHA